MGRVKSKGKKLTMSSQDDLGSGEEEKIPAQKKRGRPLKPVKHEIEEDNDVQKQDDEDSDDTTSGVDKDAKSKSGVQNVKRKKNGQAKDQGDSMKDETENGTRSSTEESNKPNGFRPSHSRRKNNTPRRAAESVVECN